MLNIKRFRKTQTIASIAIFLIVFFICWHVTKFKIADIQLSYWGVESKINWLWNSCLAILAISMGFNTYSFIEGHQRAQFKKLPKILFLLVFFSLFLTAIIDMHYRIHNITAFFYFFVYPLSIFLFAHLNRKILKYKEWLVHLCVSVAITILPLILIKMFHGMAIAETIHGLIIIGWNIWILSEE